MKKFFAGMLMLFSQFLCSQNKSDSIYQTYAIHNNLPLFYKTVEEGLNYPFDWYLGNFTILTRGIQAYVPKLWNVY